MFSNYVFDIIFVLKCKSENGNGVIPTVYLNKERCCEESSCSYMLITSMNFRSTPSKNIHIHTLQNWSCSPSWLAEFAAASDIIDVLSKIHAYVPNGIVLGDYVIECGDDEAGDEYEVYHRVRRNRWASCIFCKAFRRSPRGWRRARARERREAQQRVEAEHMSRLGSVRRSNYIHASIMKFDMVTSSNPLPVWLLIPLFGTLHSRLLIFKSIWMLLMVLQ